MTISIVTDSNSQIPRDLAERYGIVVVSMTVTVDGVDYLEGVDLDADAFYARFERATPTVSTAQPSPGQFASIYQEAIDGGADEVLSVHIGAAISGTINSARLGAAAVGVPVRIVDTGQASFAITLATWAAAEAAARGATIEEAAAAAERTAAAVGNVFAVRALDLARAGGRLAEPAGSTRAGAIPVMTMTAGAMSVVGEAVDLGEVADLMAARIRSGGTNLRVGVGVADAGMMGLWDAVEDRLAGAPEVAEVVRYRVGPSVGAHTGPGTVGAMYAPAPVDPP
jgi:DegV family protein with EDD domain